MQDRFEGSERWKQRSPEERTKNQEFLTGIMDEEREDETTEGDFTTNEMYRMNLRNLIPYVLYLDYA